ncbi:hypothetical protein [Burkholderia thailandensis]|uniref:Uncharacterized protein n=1 Tax=Burkholderia thailandensis (strain ATCC 700388 / DSM 13276 / CCUG 48851 / CIP 106301 / E264) TaxID=271848 RepID=Q2SV40_BURTA|nr:hypothetical protein [Burkholderia thailandensis]ABC36393.1 hypothetical protein BTH_I2694 [Burkholderia thailandensis E264]AWY59966.1 hypothetical protein A8H35_17955 [Burkholderia thailandensis]MBS2131573.1 hypothetical protein [Burkholderia thailandensis]MCS3399583.1 hypothetical protein [Burkholderia thailandensis]MCS6498031.1 hypothetical protein [Burkholderia thailandensis]
MLNGLLMNFDTDIFRFSLRPTTSRAPVFVHASVRATTTRESTAENERQERRAFRTRRAPIVDKSSSLLRIDEQPAHRAASARRAAPQHPNPPRESIARRAY